MKLYKHQEETISFIDKAGGRAFVASDPGTGKTAALLLWFVRAKAAGRANRLLVLCPKSIMTAAWLSDIKTFAPTLKAIVATGSSANKLKALADLRYEAVITNHDSIRIVPEDLAKAFDTIVVDESTAFKTPSAARTKALLKLSAHWKNRIAMSGTPTPQSILDLWAQIKFVRPEKLKTFAAFRAETCLPVPKRVSGGMTITEWKERPGAKEAVTAYLADTIIRYAREDCIDLPERSFRTLKIDLSKKLRSIYESFKNTSVLELNDSMTTAVHAAALMQKLVQISSGFVYDADHEGHCLSEERYELISQLVEEREYSLVAVLFKAQRDHLSKVLRDKGISFAVIDGETPTEQRYQIVTDYQNGKYRTLLCHPRSAGHGLTLTKADTTIWAAPTPNVELFDQFNARAYRVGQTRPTEVIMIAATNTYDEALYQRLLDKRNSQLSLLDLLKEG